MVRRFPFGLELGSATSNCASRRKRPAARRCLPETHPFHVDSHLPGWFGRVDLGEKWRLFLACLRAPTLYLFGALAFLFFVQAPPAYAQQVTRVPPFVGTHSETWERFGVRAIPSGTSILGGIATISGDHMVTAHSFPMCSVVGRPSDGQILMDSDRPSGPLTIRFSEPVFAFGAYWGSGFSINPGMCFGNPPSILTFRDAAGNVIGTDSFVYRGDGTLMWRGYRFGTPVKTITRTAGDGVEGVAIDGLQASVASLDFNGDGHSDYVLQNPTTRQTAIWYLNNNVLISGAYGPTLPAGWELVAAADFNGSGKPDYVLYNASTRQTAIWYMNNNVFVSGAYGPTLPAGWELVAAADFNGGGKPDYVLYNASTRQTAIWYMNNNVVVSGAYGPTLPAGWELVATADFNGSGKPDYVLYNANTRQTAIWYMNNNVFVSGAYGPTLPAGWELVATADFNGGGKPDYVLYNANTRQTAIWYMNNNVFVSGAYGPTLPAGWSLVGP
jgi:hypothetical protein